MTDKLPPNLLALFAPRPALRYLPPSDHAPEERHTSKIGGVGQFLEALHDYKDADAYVPTESWLQKRDRIKQEKQEKQERLLTEGIKEYKPAEDTQVRGDAFKTLFVARLGYDVEQKDLEREFGRFGPIERIRIVTNPHEEEKKAGKKKHRGYAFIVYEREKDMKAAYKETDGIRIKDRRVLVDVERGRTVSGWRPRRFGGGLGGRGYTKALPARPSGPGFGPPAGPGGFRGGFGGGFRGGFRGGRGGFGDRGGFRGGFGDRGGYGGGGRGGIGYQSNGFGSGAPPEGAPSGPRGGRGGGFGGGGGYGGRPSFGGPGPDAPNGGGYGGGGRYDGRSRGGDRFGSGSNRDPVGKPREMGGGYRDRDRDGGYGGGRDDYPRKRGYEGDGGYEDPRSKRRY